MSKFLSIFSIGMIIVYVVGIILGLYLIINSWRAMHKAKKDGAQPEKYKRLRTLFITGILAVIICSLRLAGF